MPPERHAAGTWLLSAAFIFIWATGFIVARLARPHADPFTFLSLRYAFGIAVFGIASLLLRAAWPRDWRTWRDAAIAGVLLHGLYIGGVFWAIWQGLPAGVTALVTALHPLLTALVARPMLGERLGARQWGGIALGLAGVAGVVAPALRASQGLDALALAAAFGATLALSVGTVWQKYSRPVADLRVNATMQFLGALVLTAPVALLTEAGRFDGSLEAWGALAWAVIVISVGAISLLLVLLRRGAATRVAPLMYLAPPVAAGIAWLLFDERLEAVQLAGAALTIAGAYAARR